MSKDFTVLSDKTSVGRRHDFDGESFMSAKNNSGVNMESLWFYFDSIERDCMDLGMLDRKSSQVQALKGKLMRLPPAQFDAAIKTIERLVDDATPGTQKRDIEAAKKKASVELYERTAAAGDRRDSKVESTSRIN